MITQSCLLGLNPRGIKRYLSSPDPPYNKQGLIGKKPVGNQIWNKFNIDHSHDDNCLRTLSSMDADVLNECYRVIKPNGSIFFNHKPRRYKNRLFTH